MNGIKKCLINALPIPYGVLAFKCHEDSARYLFDLFKIRDHHLDIGNIFVHFEKRLRGNLDPQVFCEAKRLEQQAKGMVVPATLFEKFGFNYIGPIDGHDLDALIPTLENLRHLRGPQFLHVVTRKGQGYKLAEADPVAYHGPGKFDPDVAAPFTENLDEFREELASKGVKVPE